MNTLKTSSLPPAYTGPTLLEMTMQDVLTLIINRMTGRVRIRDNLHILATRGLFPPTDQVSNDELLRIMEVPEVDIGRESKVPRHLRSMGSARTMKFHQIRSAAVKLLRSKVVSQAHSGSKWAYSVIHQSAYLAVHEVRKTQGEFDMAALQSNPTLANEMLNHCFDFISKTIYEELTTGATETINAQELRFLHYAASVVISAMDRPVNPTQAMHDLLFNVYPELDKHTFETA